MRAAWDCLLVSPRPSPALISSFCARAALHRRLYLPNALPATRQQLSPLPTYSVGAHVAVSPYLHFPRERKRRRRGYHLPLPRIYLPLYPRIHHPARLHRACRSACFPIRYYTTYHRAAIPSTATCGRPARTRGGIYLNHLRSGRGWTSLWLTSAARHHRSDVLDILLFLDVCHLSPNSWVLSGYLCVSSVDLSFTIVTLLRASSYEQTIPWDKLIQHFSKRCHLRTTCGSNRRAWFFANFTRPHTTLLHMTRA